jgi:hypothetical protein
VLPFHGKELPFRGKALPFYLVCKNCRMATLLPLMVAIPWKSVAIPSKNVAIPWKRFVILREILAIPENGNCCHSAEHKLLPFYPMCERATLFCRMAKELPLSVAILQKSISNWVNWQHLLPFSVAIQSKSVAILQKSVAI